MKISTKLKKYGSKFASKSENNFPTVDNAEQINCILCVKVSEGIKDNANQNYYGLAKTCDISALQVKLENVI